ncbi:unnamed protein product [Choristocarpus tenellus]
MSQGVGRGVETSQGLHGCGDEWEQGGPPLADPPTLHGVNAPAEKLDDPAMNWFEEEFGSAGDGGVDAGRTFFADSQEGYGVADGLHQGPSMSSIADDVNVPLAMSKQAAMPGHEEASNEGGGKDIPAAWQEQMPAFGRDNPVITRHNQERNCEENPSEKHISLVAQSSPDAPQEACGPTPDYRYLQLEVFCDDQDGEEVVLPPVRLDMRSASLGSGDELESQGRGELTSVPESDLSPWAMLHERFLGGRRKGGD